MLKILGFGFGFIRLERKSYVMFMLMSLVISAISVLIPLLEGEIINALHEGGYSRLIELIIVFCIISIISLIISLFNNRLYLHLQASTCNSASVSIIKKLYNIPYLHVADRDPSELHQAIDNDINTIMIFVLNFFKNLMVQGLSMILIMLVLLKYSLYLTVGIATLMIAYIVIYVLLKKKIYNSQILVKERAALYFSSVYHLIANIKPIRINAFKEEAFGQHIKSFKEYYSSLCKQQNITNLNIVASSSIALATQAFIFLYGGYLVFENILSIGMLVTVLNYFFQLIGTAKFYLSIGSEYQNALSSFDRLKKYKDFPGFSSGNAVIGDFKSFSIDCLSFSFNLNTILNNLNYRFRTGKIYWLKGRNGTGKSTLVNIILGLYGNEYSGNILIDKMNIKKIDINVFLKNNVAICEQVPFLMDESLEYNLCCKGNQSCPHDLDYLINGFELKGMIQKLPYGLSTSINSFIDNMSGGEKQKIVLIRALLSSAKLIILDEPVSSLDAKSIDFLISYLTRIKKDKIIILISHVSLPCFDEVIDLSK